MRKIFALTIMFSMLVVNACACYHMQVPRTVPEGKLSGGLGFSTSHIKFTRNNKIPGIPIPSIWLRTGLSPHVDFGVNVWGLGLKFDVKYSFNDYFALGAGGAMSVLDAFLYGAEGSAYFGIPVGKIFYPYAVTRLNLMCALGGDAEASDEVLGKYANALSGVGGLRIQFGKALFIYTETGWRYPLGHISPATDSSSSDTLRCFGTPIFGLGVSLGY